MAFCEDNEIPVMVCWNNDYGDFCGNLRQVHIHDAMEIESRMVDEDTFDFAGLDCTTEGNAIVIGDERFAFVRRGYNVGNLYWDFLVMEAPEFLRFLNHLRASNVYSINSGESSLFEYWNSGKPFTDLELGKVVEYVQDFRL
jgi:hypothetical protein